MQGLILEERYRIIRKLGHGGMGEVWLARDMQKDEEIALKMILDRRLLRKNELKKFKQEFLIAKNIQSEFIVKMFDFYESRGQAFYTMEYIKGEPLSAFAGQPVKECLRLFIMIAKGLVDLHNYNIIHRDLKPSNIIVTENGSLKILDFGLAAFRAVETAEKSGTVHYMAPEVFQRGEFDPRTDLYSIGVMLFELLFKKRPYTMPPGLYGTVGAGEQLKIPADTNPRLGLCIKRLLSVDPAERYADGITLLNELESLKNEYGDDEEKSAKPRTQKQKIHPADFISRRVEMSRVINAVDNFLATRVDYTVIIEGDRGVGKSRFLEEIHAKMVFRNIGVLQIAASETQNLILDLLLGIWDVLDREIRFQVAMKWGRMLLYYFPEFGRFGEFKHVRSGDDLPSVEEEFNRIVAILGDIIRMATLKKPLIIIIDNFHEVDRRSLSIIQELLIHKEENRGVFTLVSISVDNRSAQIEIPANAKVTLTPFTLNETRDFVESALRKPRRNIDESLFLWVYRSSQGVVKMVLSILYMLKEERLMFVRSDRIVFRNDILEHESIDFLFRRKLDSLSDNQRLILRAASIYRKFNTAEAMRAVLAGRMEQIDFDLNYEILKMNYLIEEQKNGKMRIVNGRLQSMIYASLPEEERRDFHLRHALYLMHENPLEDVNIYAFAAYHYLRGGDELTALRLYLRSASRTFFHLNTELAGSFLEEALSMLRSNTALLSHKQVTAVQLFAGRIFAQLGFHSRAVPLLEEAYQVWRHDMVLELLVRSLINDGDTKRAQAAIRRYKATGEEKKAFVHYLQAMIAGKASMQYNSLAYHLNRTRSLIQSGNTHYITPQRQHLLAEMEFEYTLLTRPTQYDVLKSLRNDLVEGAKRLRSKVYLIDALTMSYRFLSKFGKIEKAFRTAQQILKFSIEIFDNYRIAKAYHNLAQCARLLERWNDIGFYLDKAMEYARKGCGSRVLKDAYLARGEYALITGDYSLAENYLFNAEELSYREHEDADLISIYAGQIFLYILKGETGYARNSCGKLRRFMDQHRTLDGTKQIVGLTALLFLEAMSEGDREYILELSTRIEKLFVKHPEQQKTYLLLYITAQVIYAAKKGYDADINTRIEQVELERVTSDNALFNLLYFYYTAQQLSKRKLRQDVLRRYIEQGRLDAVKYQSRQFIALFGELSFLIDQDESDIIVSEMRSQLDEILVHQPGDTEKLRDEMLEKLKLHLDQTRRQIEFLRIKNRNYAYIIDIVKAISGRTEVQKILDISVKKIIDILAADLVAIVFLQEDGQQGEYLIRDAAMQSYKMGDIKFKSDVVPRMMKTAKIEFLATPYDGTETDTNYSSSNIEFDNSAVAAIPVVLQGEIKAYIYLERAISKGAFTEEELNFLEVLVDNIGVIFDNVKLIEIATTDMLTKVATRRHFLNILRKETEKARRYGFTLSLVIIDIDFFKTINDTYGHLMGDTVLKMLGKLLKTNVRGSDYVGRLGGEEFALLLSGTNGQGALNTAEKIREKCEKMNFSGIQVTISAGVASYHEDAVRSDEDFIEKADTALYAAKRSGRNRAITFSDRGF